MVEEVPQVHFQADLAIMMRLSKIKNVISRAEATSQRVSRNQVQDFAENLLLYDFQFRLGRFEQPPA